MSAFPKGLLECTRGPAAELPALWPQMVFAENFCPAVSMFSPPQPFFLAQLMLRMPEVWFRVPVAARLFLPAGR